MVRVLHRDRGEKAGRTIGKLSADGYTEGGKVPDWNRTSMIPSLSFPLSSCSSFLRGEIVFSTMACRTTRQHARVENLVAFFQLQADLALIGGRLPFGVVNLIARSQVQFRSAVAIEAP